MKKENEFVIYDNYDYCDLFDEIKAEKERECDEDEWVSDEEVWEAFNDCDETFWEDAEREMKAFFSDKENGFIITGTVGSWYGAHEGGKIFKDWDDLFNRPNPFEDCDYFRFYDKDGHFYVHCSHHDGSCDYEIKELTKRGAEYYDNWNWYHIPNDKRTDRYICTKIMTDSHYAHLPRFAEKVYGA